MLSHYLLHDVGLASYFHGAGEYERHSAEQYNEAARSLPTTPVTVPSPFITDHTVYLRSFKSFLFANSTTTHTQSREGKSDMTVSNINPYPTNVENRVSS